MKAKLSEGLIDQIRKTVIVQDKHLLISDADEVLLNFLPCFENYLQNNSMWYDLKSYALFGNIKNKVSNESISNEDVLFHLENFFKNRSRQIDFVKDSIKSLNKLINILNFQIIILTNIPFKYLEDRKACFRDNGLELPIIAGNGPKGLVIKELVKSYNGKIFFIDDLAPHIISSKLEVKRAKTIHYISDERLSTLAKTPKEADFRANSWKEIYNFIKDEIKR